MMSGSQAERSWRFIRRLEYYSSPPQERRKPSASLNWACPLRQALLTIELVPPPFENRTNIRRICHTLAVLLVCVGLLCAASGFIFDYLHPEYVPSFPSYLYLLRAVPSSSPLVSSKLFFRLLKRRNKGRRNASNFPEPLMKHGPGSSDTHSSSPNPWGLLNPPLQQHSMQPSSPSPEHVDVPPAGLKPMRHLRP